MFVGDLGTGARNAHFRGPEVRVDHATLISEQPVSHPCQLKTAPTKNASNRSTVPIITSMAGVTGSGIRKAMF